MRLMVEPGEKYTILVDGNAVTTVIDEKGIQRFIENSVVSWLIRTAQIDINKVWTDFYVQAGGDIKADCLKEFYMAMGYEVAVFDEVFGFGSSYHKNTGDYVETVNPLWLEDEEGG